MERYFKRKTKAHESSNIELEQQQEQAKDLHDEVENIHKKRCLDINLDELPIDPGLRKKISDYHPNLQDEIRRYYLQKGPCQPREHTFPQRMIGKKSRRFVNYWFDRYKNWLEYSIEKDATFCLCCYLYRPDIGEQGSGDSFVGIGFTNWKKKDRFDVHVGDFTSAHNQAWRKCQNLMNQNQHLEVAFSRHSDRTRIEYRTRLAASIDCAKFLLHQGLAFRGHDESNISDNQGNFLELLHFLADHNDDIKRVVLDNAPKNLKLTAPEIQKDITNALARETTSIVVNEIGNGLFAILGDESRDVSMNEQMAIVLRCVNSQGCVIERFLGILHVSDTTALSLKLAIDELFSKHSLSISQVRGQGYDGASNMRGEYNGLKSLILKENGSAYYIHCFAHQLQLSLVGVAKKHVQVFSMYNTLSILVHVLEGSAKRHEILREKRLEKVVNDMLSGELATGRGLNQETSLQRACDTRWGSHYGSLLKLILMFDSVIDVLEIIEHDGVMEQRGQAYVLLNSLQSFEFAFILHLMKKVMGITNALSEALQRRDQDIVNAMNLVSISKQKLQVTRDDGWDSLFNEICSFCEKHEISIPGMDEKFVTQGRSRRKVQEITNLHHYRVDLFCAVIDLQLQELNHRFNEVNTELLLCMACLNPSDSFSSFDKEKLIRLAEFYPCEFSKLDILALSNELDTYILDMKSSNEFSQLRRISDLSEKLVKTKRDLVYPLVYMLIKLALIMPVATATVERAFSAMNIVKNRLRSRMGDSWMNDCLVTYIEKKIFQEVEQENVIKRYQNMKTRSEQL